MLALIPSLKAQLQHIESSTAEEVRRVEASLEEQIQNQIAGLPKCGERPVLRALPAARPGNGGARTLRVKDTRGSSSQATTQKKFDTRAFVFACLQGNSDLKLSEIEQLVLARGQELSQASISRYRKQFFASRESSTMKAESGDESCLDESESMAIGQ